MVPFKDLLCTSFKDLNLFRLKGKPVRRLSCGQPQKGLRSQRPQASTSLRSRSTTRRQAAGISPASSLVTSFNESSELKTSAVQSPQAPLRQQFGPVHSCHHKAQPTTEKRRRPRPKAGSDVAFNDGCCNYSSSSLLVVPRWVLGYTLVSASTALTRRYSPSSGKPLDELTPTAHSNFSVAF